MSGRLWLGFVSTVVLLFHLQLQAFGNPLWQSSDDEDGKATKDGFPCYSQADCVSGECCLVYGDDSDQQGVCKKLGTIGSRCSVVSDPDQKTIRAEYCPCIKELECLPSSETCRENVGVFDRFLNIFSPNNDDDNKEVVNNDNSANDDQQTQDKNDDDNKEVVNNDNSANDDQQTQEKNDDDEEEEEPEEEAQEEESQEQEQEQEAEVQQEEEETDTQGEDGEDKKEEEDTFW